MEGGKAPTIELASVAVCIWQSQWAFATSATKCGVADVQRAIVAR